MTLERACTVDVGHAILRRWKCPLGRISDWSTTHAAALSAPRDRPVRKTSGVGTEVSCMGGAGAVVWVERIGRNDERREARARTYDGVGHTTTVDQTATHTDQPGLPNQTPEMEVRQMSL